MIGTGPRPAVSFDPYDYRTLIEAALVHSGGTHVFADIVKGVESGRYQFWPAPESVVVTEILRLPRKQVVHCFLAAGKLEEIQVQRRWLEGWAKSIGCEAVTIAGRPGWEKVLGGDGYRKAAVLLEKEI